jgi:hypothetical protein
MALLLIDDSFKCIRIMLKILLCIVEEAVLWQTSPCTWLEFWMFKKAACFCDCFNIPY